MALHSVGVISLDCYNSYGGDMGGGVGSYGGGGFVFSEKGGS